MEKKQGTPTHEENAAAFFAQLNPDVLQRPIDPVEIKKRNASKSAVFAMRYAQK